MLAKRSEAVINQVSRIAAAVMMLAAATGIVHAQEKSEPAAAKVTLPLKLQVVISRFQGDKKISSMPYMLSVNAGRVANLRMGTRVPVTSTSYTPVATGGAGVNPLTSFQYLDVGTNIDCSTAALDDGRFRVDLTIEDSSLFPDDQTRGGTDRPSLRSFRATNSMVLANGQTAQFTTATDKASGEVTKVDVTLTVVK
jgi:type II secretory pathway component GspD/PulD (secretin)